MAHLIKLEDYISRYQFDLHRYPSQYSRMKKERWYYMKSEWEQLQFDSVHNHLEDQTLDSSSEEQGLLAQAIQRMKKWTKRNHDEEVINYDLPLMSHSENELKHLSLDQVKQIFLDELYDSQLRWASSSLLEESTMHPQYKRDRWLRFFSQQIPDNYFLMYKPVFFIKKAPIELDVILISPSEVICMTMVEGHEHSIFEASSDRFWIEYINESRKKRISPLLSLSRMTGVIGGMLEEAEISFPIRKVVLCPNSIIDNKIQGAKVELIDRRTFDAWHKRINKHPSPLKHQQMKVTALLLDHCHTISYQLENDQMEEDGEK